jgi:UDP-2,3-diacylglucosamine pyrophosphatase LpxH
VIVISDLHLGGREPRMMTHPGELAAFIRGLPNRATSNEDLELVIAGDFVDFLAIEPFAAWTPDPVAAKTKIAQTMTGFFGPIFDGLAELVANGHRLTVIVGNHDVEMALPSVQEALLERLGTRPHQVHFVDDGRAYRIGGALIEHGNRYDGANRNDWGNLRAIASALSRGEPSDTNLEVSPGSRIVERIVNKLRFRYPFINLLQPEGELLAFLLVSFEPSLKWDVDKLAQLFRAGLRKVNEKGQPPGTTQYIGYFPLDEPDPELEKAYGDTYDALRRPDQQVGVIGDFGRLLVQSDSLSELLDLGEPVPTERLQQIRLVMRRLLLGDVSASLHDDTGPYAKAAARMRTGQIEVVVMGHTHQARHIGSDMKAFYINTGTWADVVRVPGILLEQGTDTELTRFLQELRTQPRRQFQPAYADLRVEADGSVTEARLVSHEQVCN